MKVKFHFIQGPWLNQDCDDHDTFGFKCKFNRKFDKKIENIIVDFPCMPVIGMTVGMRSYFDALLLNEAEIKVMDNDCPWMYIYKLIMNIDSIEIWLTYTKDYE